MRRYTLFIIALLFIAGCDHTEISDTSGEDLFFLKNDGAIMPVRVMGNKTSNRFVIFLHGGPGGNIIDARDFLAQSMEPIEEDVAMVYWDQRCAGSAQGNCNRRELSFEAYLQDLDALIVLLKHHYGEDLELYLMTHSFGGWLATLYLADWDQDEQIRGWINMDGAYSADFLVQETKKMLNEVGSRQIAQGFNVEKWQAMIEEANALDLATLDGRAALNTLAYEAPGLMVDVDSVNTPQITGNLATVFNSPGSPLAIVTNNLITETSPFVKEIFLMDHSAKLASINLPVLLLWGKYDFVVPPTSIQDFTSRVGSDDITAVLFERSEHTPMVTEPVKFSTAVRAFLAR